MTLAVILLQALVLAENQACAEDLGNLSANPFDPDSTSNQFGRYGLPFSGESINNLFGAGSPYRYDSPTNPYGRGLKIEGR